MREVLTHEDRSVAELAIGNMPTVLNLAGVRYGETLDPVDPSEVQEVFGSYHTESRDIIALFDDPSKLELV